MSFLVCFRARYTVGYAVWRLGTEEPRLLGHRTRVRLLCAQERYAAALATGNCPLASEDHTKVQKKLVSMRSYREELSLRTDTAYEVCLRNPRIAARS